MKLLLGLSLLLIAGCSLSSGIIKDKGYQEPRTRHYIQHVHINGSTMLVPQVQHIPGYWYVEYCQQGKCSKDEITMEQFSEIQIGDYYER